MMYIEGGAYPKSLGGREGAFFEYPYFVCVVRDLAPREVAIFKSSKHTFDVIEMDTQHAFCVAWSLDHGRICNDMVFASGYSPELYRERLAENLSDPESQYLWVGVHLVDAKTNTLLAMNYFTLTPTVSNKIHELIASQLAVVDQFTEAKIRASQERLYDRYPDPKAMIGKGIVRCVGGEDEKPEALPVTALIASLAKAYQQRGIRVPPAVGTLTPPEQFWKMDSFIFDADDIARMFSFLESPAFFPPNMQSGIFVVQSRELSAVFVLVVEGDHGDHMDVFPYVLKDGVWHQNVIAQRLAEIILSMAHILAQPRDVVIKAELHYRTRKFNEKNRRTGTMIPQSRIVVLDKNVPLTVTPPRGAPAESRAPSENSSTGVGTGPVRKHWRHQRRGLVVGWGCAACADDSSPSWRPGRYVHAGVVVNAEKGWMHCEQCHRFRWPAGSIEAEPVTTVVIAKRTPDRTHDAPELAQ